MKHLPGPLPSSCLTCRQRRKKCDKGHPACARCTVGGFRCLGYEYIASSSSSSSQGASSSQLDTALVLPSTSYKPRKAPQRTHVIHALEEAPRHRTTLLDESLSTATGVRTDHNAVEGESLNSSASRAILDPGYSPPNQISPQPRGGPEEFQPRSNEIVPLSLITIESLVLPSSKLPAVRSSSPQDLVLLPSNSSGQQQKPSTSNAANPLTLPPRFYPDPVISGSTIKFILSLYEPLFDLLAFKPREFRCEHIRTKLMSRIQTCSLTHWSMYLGAKVLRTLLQGGEEADLRAYDPWFERLDKLCITSSNDNVLEDLAGRLSSALELSYLKFITSDIKSGYALLKNIAPTFMKVAFADPTLWPRHPNTSGISLVHAYMSYNFEVVRFVSMDALTSFTFGVPPLVEYDTSSPATETERRRVQLVESLHGYPATLGISMIKVNIWRAQGHDAPVKHSWEEIEADILGWNPQPDDAPLGDSWRTVARLASQEGWRHAGLIYLYMGMCGVTSHDPRVQSSVQQIMNMLDVMQFDEPVCVHFFFPCLLAGICVRGEKQRALVRRYLTQSKKNTAWLLRGADIVSVLDHLWHREAANGGAVTWEDYISSIRANIRIDP